MTSRRRSFLRQAALFPVAAALTPSAANAAVTPVKRVGGSYLKASLNAYSFLPLLNANAKDPSQGMDLFAVCDFCARHNFDAVDLTGYFFPGYPNAEKKSKGNRPCAR